MRPCPLSDLKCHINFDRMPGQSDWNVCWVSWVRQPSFAHAVARRVGIDRVFSSFGHVGRHPKTAVLIRNDMTNDFSMICLKNTSSTQLTPKQDARSARSWRNLKVLSAPHHSCAGLSPRDRKLFAKITVFAQLNSAISVECLFLIWLCWSMLVEYSPFWIMSVHFAKFGMVKLP